MNPYVLFPVDLDPHGVFKPDVPDEFIFMKSGLCRQERKVVEPIRI